MRQNIKGFPEQLRKAADYLMFGKNKKGNLRRLFLSAPVTVPLIFWAAAIDSFLEKVWEKPGDTGYPH